MAQTMETMKKHGTQPTRRDKFRGLQRGENLWGIAFVQPDADRRHHFGTVSDIGNARVGFRRFMIPGQAILIPRGLSELI